MAGNGDQIQRIYTKLQQLLKRFDALQKDNLRLKQTVESLQAEKIAGEETIRELRLKNDVLKATTTIKNNHVNLRITFPIAPATIAYHYNTFVFPGCATGYIPFASGKTLGIASHVN